MRPKIMKIWEDFQSCKKGEEKPVNGVNAMELSFASFVDDGPAPGPGKERRR
jgi:hypothetical protein